MKKVVWELEYLSVPKVIRHCRKCGKKTYYESSNLFRVNAQKKNLDIWMIYKCQDCDNTWNAEIYSRVNPQKIEAELARFHKNDAELALSYAMNWEWLKQNQAEVELPDYKIRGEDVSASERVEISIINSHDIPYKLAAVLRKKLSLSQKEFQSAVQVGSIIAGDKSDLRKAKLGKKTIILQNSN